MADIDGNVIEDNDGHILEVHLQGDPIPDNGSIDLQPIEYNDHFTGISLEGEPVEEAPYDGYCEEVAIKKIKQIDKALFNMMEGIIADPLTAETEVDGLRVKRYGVKSQIDMMNYLRGSRNAIKYNHLKGFMLCASGYGHKYD